MISVEELKQLNERGDAYQALKLKVEKLHPDIAFSGLVEDVSSKVVYRSRAFVIDTGRLN